MADSTKHYVLRGDKALAESMTKEEILTAITQAVEQGEIHDIDTGFVESIKEQNSGAALKMWIGTQAQYNAIATPERNVLYIISDDTTDTDLEEAIDEINDKLEAVSTEIPDECFNTYSNNRHFEPYADNKLIYKESVGVCNIRGAFKFVGNALYPFAIDANGYANVVSGGGSNPIVTVPQNLKYPFSDDATLELELTTDGAIKINNNSDTSKTIANNTVFSVNWTYIK